MATIAVNAQPLSTALAEPKLTLDSLPYIDMTTFTQSELQALSRCSLTAPPRSPHDIVIPAIDRSIFNESSGSRRQTFSRPHYHPHHHRHRLSGLTSLSPPTSSADPVENRYIINFLKQFLTSNPPLNQQEFAFFNSVRPQSFIDPLAAIGSWERKRKRGRKPKVKQLSVVDDREREIGLKIVNKNGIPVDLVKLENLDDPYGEEMRMRTVGMEHEEELLGFFRDLKGQWCSKRKKRTIIDASILGDVLPDGWKLLLALRRKDGRASVYCRRYISPGGQHFISCKEISAYLQSYIEPCNLQQVVDNAVQDHTLPCKTHPPYEESSHSTVSLFECHKCNVPFDEKDKYLQHLLSFHHKTPRKYGLGSNVGDGVIMKDGNYECQFCHKVFHERRRYNGHVGIHVRNFVRGIEDSPADIDLHKKQESPTEEEMPTKKVSRIDALIEIAQNSIPEDSSTGPSDDLNSISICSKLKLGSNTEIPASIFDHHLNDDLTFRKQEIGDKMTNANYSDHELGRELTDSVITGEKRETDDNTLCLDFYTNHASFNEQQTLLPEISSNTIVIDNSQLEQNRRCGSLSLALLNQELFGLENNVISVSDISPESPNLDELTYPDEIKLGLNFGSNSGMRKGIVKTVRQPSEDEDKVIQSGFLEPSVSLIHPLHDFTFSDLLDKQSEIEFHRIHQRTEDTERLEELRFDMMEQVRFSYSDTEISLSQPAAHMDFENNLVTGGAYGSSVLFEAENLININMGERQQLTTACVWCGIAFSHQAMESWDIQSESVGYMCPTCKAKINGEYNFMDGLP